MSKRLLSAEHQSYHGVGIAVYFIYIYIFVTVVIEECDGPRAFVQGLRWVELKRVISAITDTCSRCY